MAAGVGGWTIDRGHRSGHGTQVRTQLSAMVDGVKEQHPHQTGVRHLRNEMSIGQKLRRGFISCSIVQRREFRFEHPLSVAVQLDSLLQAREGHLPGG